MKSSTLPSASLVAVLAIFSQSAIANASIHMSSQHSIDPDRVSNNRSPTPQKIALQPSSLVAQQSGISIGNIKNIDDSGPACWYWRVGKKGRNRTILSTWAVSGGGAVMNLNGNDTKLKTVVPWKSYSLDDIKIQVKTKSHVSSDSDSTDKGTIVITNAGRSQTIKVEGYCGV
jgi:hypothetical protein